MYWYEKFYSGAFDPIVGFKDEATTLKEAMFALDVLDLPREAYLLDLACGFGRHSAIFSSSGLNVVGLDASTYYIATAKANAQKSGDSTEYIKGDMREILYTNHFDAVVNMFTSFGFFNEDEQNLQVLQSVANALKPNGKFLLDYANPFFFVNEYVANGDRNWKYLDDGSLAITKHEFNVITQREKMTAKIIDANGTETESCYDIRLYNPVEIEKMLVSAGLTIQQWFGDYDGADVDSLSPRLIILATKS